MQPRRSGEPYGAEHLIERQMLLWNVRRSVACESPTEKSALPFRFLTISRDVGSLGDEIASALARGLSWHIYDREIVDYISQNSHVRQSLVRELDEKAQNLIHDTVQRLLRMAEGGSFGNEEYHEALLRTVVFLGTQGEAILVGRGANFILRDHAGLHVRILASAEVRIERLGRRWLVTPREARRRMEQLDVERRHFIRHHFKRDLDDLRFYDLVFNTDHVSTDQVVGSILAAMGFHNYDTKGL